MKEVEIENRIETTKSEKDFLMVDLIIDGQKIDTGSNPIESFCFWEDINGQSQRSLYRIKKNNPNMSFDFNFATMGMTEEQKEQRFRSHIKSRYPNIDVDRLFDLFDKEVSEIKMVGPDDNHPNPELNFPIGSHMTKNLMISVLEKFLKEKCD